MSSQLEAVEIGLTTSEGVLTEGRLRIQLLPGSRSRLTIDPLLDLRGSPPEGGAEPIQLLESVEYKYDLLGVKGSCEWEPVELFFPDSASGLSGRLRPALNTGSISVQVSTEGREPLQCGLEVRSRKLDYQSQYQFMLRDIATTCTEVIMKEFSPAEQHFRLDPTSSTQTLYQHFVFLDAVLRDPRLEAALAKVVSRPYLSWDVFDEIRPASRGIRSSGSSSRSLASGGRRQRWENGPLPSVPATIDHRRTDAVVDNVPNRFVRFALEFWRDNVLQVRETLARAAEKSFTKRAVAQADRLLGILETHLSAGIFREVRRISSFPHSNQVLMRQDGYRDLLRTFLESQVAANLSWDGAEDVYRAGQRNVAELYEYWVYIQFGQILARLTGSEFNLKRLIEQSADGLSLSLKEGRHHVLSGTITRLGRRMSVELWYNRTFSKDVSTAHSWSVPMRPDLSVFVSPAEGELADFEPVWLHFDAKYRIQEITEIFGDAEVVTSELATLVTSMAKREDLLKMHSYRDAIRKTAGSFVVYPGPEGKRFQEYHELLPGLGAFTLQPSETGEAEGTRLLAKYLEDVFDHIGSQVTQHERGRFWVDQVFATARGSVPASPSVTFLKKPAADTQVLCGFVKSREHLSWVRTQQLYNVRADDRRGSVPMSFVGTGIDLVLLYGPMMGAPEVWAAVGPAIVMTAEQLSEVRYPEPRGHLYLCLQLARVPNADVRGVLGEIDFERLRQYLDPGSSHGEPFKLSWLEMMESRVLP